MYPVPIARYPNLDGTTSRGQFADMDDIAFSSNADLNTMQVFLRHPYLIPAGKLLVFMGFLDALEEFFYRLYYLTHIWSCIVYVFSCEGV